MPYKESQRSQEQELTGVRRLPQTERGGRGSEGSTGTHELRRAVANPRGASPAALLTIQRTYGNRAVQRLLQTAEPSVQRFKWNPFKKATPAKKDTDLKVLLRNKEFHRQFYIFSVKEFSTENIECWSDIEAYRDNPNMPRARRIYNQYFADELAARAVNIPNTVRVELTRVMDEVNREGAGNRASAATLFDKALDAVLINLSDTYARFTGTPEYAEWRKANPNV